VPNEVVAAIAPAARINRLLAAKLGI